jgi:hypothetical protein
VHAAQVFWQTLTYTVTATNASGTSFTQILVQVDSGVLSRDSDHGDASANTPQLLDRFRTVFHYVDSLKRKVL